MPCVHFCQPTVSGHLDGLDVEKASGSTESTGGGGLWRAGSPNPSPRLARRPRCRGDTFQQTSAGISQGAAPVFPAPVLGSPSLPGPSLLLLHHLSVWDSVWEASEGFPLQHRWGRAEGSVRTAALMAASPSSPVGQLLGDRAVPSIAGMCGLARSAPLPRVQPTQTAFLVWFPSSALTRGVQAEEARPVALGCSSPSLPGVEGPCSGYKRKASPAGWHAPQRTGLCWGSQAKTDTPLSAEPSNRSAGLQAPSTHSEGAPSLGCSHRGLCGSCPLKGPLLESFQDAFAQTGKERHFGRPAFRGAPGSRPACSILLPEGRDRGGLENLRELRPWLSSWQLIPQAHTGHRLQEGHNATERRCV